MGIKVFSSTTVVTVALQTILSLLNVAWFETSEKTYGKAEVLLSIVPTLSVKINCLFQSYLKNLSLSIKSYVKEPYNEKLSFTLLKKLSR